MPDWIIWAIIGAAVLIAIAALKMFALEAEGKGAAEEAAKAAQRRSNRREEMDKVKPDTDAELIDRLRDGGF